MLKVIIVLLIGAGIGAFMGYFGKCADGTCPLTANSYRGAVWGLFLASSIPNVVILKNGIEVDRIIGARGFDEYSKVLKKQVRK